MNDDQLKSKKQRETGKSIAIGIALGAAGLFAKK
jgi:hypothetical protein